MKKLMFVITCFSPLFLLSQEDCLDRLEMKITKIGELEDSIVVLNSQLNELEKNKKKKVGKLEDSLKVLYNEVESLDEENDSLKNEVTKVKEKASENDEHVQKYKDSVKDLKVKLSGLRSKNNKLKKYKDYKNEKKNALQEIKNKYNSDPEEISKLDTASLESDLRIIKLLFPEEKSLSKRIKQWLKINSSAQLLKRKYDEDAINQSINELKSLDSIEYVDNLISDLEAYDQKNEAVKNIIKSLREKNKIEVSVATNELIDEKQMKIYSFIYFEVAYAPIDLNKYTYLRSIINEIKEKKKDNIDAKLGYLLEKL